MTASLGCPQQIKLLSDGVQWRVEPIAPIPPPVSDQTVGNGGHRSGDDVVVERREDQRDRAEGERQSSGEAVVGEEQRRRVGERAMAARRRVGGDGGGSGAAAVTAGWRAGSAAAWASGGTKHRAPRGLILTRQRTAGSESCCYSKLFARWSGAPSLRLLGTGHNGE